MKHTNDLREQAFDLRALWSRAMDRVDQVTLTRSCPDDPWDRRPCPAGRHMIREVVDSLLTAADALEQAAAEFERLRLDRGSTGASSLSEVPR